jgi:hypothetical protein
MKLPKCNFSSEAATADPSDYRLGKSKKGVYCALVVDCFKLCVWFLDESSGKMEWILRKEVNLESFLANWKHIDGPWKHDYCSTSYEAPKQDEFEWDSDDDDIGGIQEGTKDTCARGDVLILGFHPNKEIVFLLRTYCNRVLAYHVNRSKLEDLGRVCLPRDAFSSFPFTPCWMGEL